MPRNLGFTFGKRGYYTIAEATWFLEISFIVDVTSTCAKYVQCLSGHGVLSESLAFGVQGVTHSLQSVNVPHRTVSE